MTLTFCHAGKKVKTTKKKPAALLFCGRLSLPEKLSAANDLYTLLLNKVLYGNKRGPLASYPTKHFAIFGASKSIDRRLFTAENSPTAGL